MTEVITVRFRSGSKEYDFDPKGMEIAPGTDVIVETSQGLAYACCTCGNHDVADEDVVQPLCPVVRIATENDQKTIAYNEKREKEAFGICQKKIAAHGLEMKLVSVSCSFDGSKIIFFFTADGRVDFRELVKDLASVFRARIELRQIGVRDEAKMIGGLGICGRPFCCSQFLDSFLPVSIKMAKTQNLSLNPTKISGTCGRLMCCLKYEQEAYEDAARRMPKQDSFVLTPDGPGNVSQVNLLKETVKVNLDEETGAAAGRCYHNCEICVLRNGKGSREGIEIPAERPERYVEEGQAEPALSVPTLLASFEEEAPMREKIGQSEEKSRRRSRRRSGRSGDSRPAAEKKPERDGGEKDRQKEPPKKAEGDKRPQKSQPRHKPQETEPHKEQPASRAPGEEEGSRRRPRHRGGRRRSHRGEGGSTPGGKSES